VFHTCQIEVAEKIIRDNKILCRSKVPELICDVANQGALWNNPDAHNYVRLYFRPKTNFHLKTEGIKSISDIYRQDPHMAIPVVFAFDFVELMTRIGTYFLPENFALTGATPLDGDANFDELNFAHIYHDASTTSENRTEIHRARMAEVVIRDELPLDTLRAVICRTVHESETLKFSLKDMGSRTPDIFIERYGGVFFRRGIFIDEIYSKSGMLHLNFHNSMVSPQQDYDIAVYSETQRWAGRLAAGRWKFSSLRATERDEVWTVAIEGCVAYSAPVPTEENMVV
jgi:hypothetical protein